MQNIKIMPFKKKEHHLLEVRVNGKSAIYDDLDIARISCQNCMAFNIDCDDYICPTVSRTLRLEV